MRITSYICDECGANMFDPARTWRYRGGEYHFCDEACKEFFIHKKLSGEEG